MRSVFKKTLPAILAGTALMSAHAAVFAAEPAASNNEIQQQITDLQAKVAQLQAQQKQADDATIKSVLDDVHQRSVSLSDAVPMASNWQAGKFSLRSDDGSFVLHPWFQLQFRNATTYRNDVGNGDSDTQNGFEVRRMKFGVDGNLFSKDTTYLINWATDRNTGNLGLEEAWLKTKLDDNWSVRGGQIKDPFAHESILSSKKAMAVERDFVTDTFTGGDNFVQGVAVGYQNDALQAEVAFTDGQNEPNRNFQDFPTNSWDWGTAGRVQFKAFGDWKDYEQFSAMDIKQDLLVFGGGVDLSQAGNTSQFLHTIDAQWSSTTGLAAYGALYGRYTQDAPKSVTPGVAEHDTYDWGAVAQLSYLIPDTKWEPFARYSFLEFDSDTLAAGAETQVHEITGGVNYYVHGHDMKFTLDVTYLPNGSPISDTSGDILASTDDEVVVRAQFQLLL